MGQFAPSKSKPSEPTNRSVPSSVASTTAANRFAPLAAAAAPSAFDGPPVSGPPTQPAPDGPPASGPSAQLITAFPHPVGADPAPAAAPCVAEPVAVPPHVEAVTSGRAGGAITTDTSSVVPTSPDEDITMKET